MSCRLLSKENDVFFRLFTFTFLHSFPYEFNTANSRFVLWWIPVLPQQLIRPPSHERLCLFKRYGVLADLCNHTGLEVSFHLVEMLKSMSHRVSPSIIHVEFRDLPRRHLLIICTVASTQRGRWDIFQKRRLQGILRVINLFGEKFFSIHLDNLLDFRFFILLFILKLFFPVNFPEQFEICFY